MTIYHKYLRVNPDNPEELGPTNELTPHLALKWALGGDYRVDGADAFEVAYGVMLVRDFAVENGNTTLVTSCDEAMKRIQADAWLLESHISNI